MRLTPIYPSPNFPEERDYLQGVEVVGATKLVFISGQIPVRPDGSVPKDFESQAHQAWENIEQVLGHAGLSIENLVYVRTYLSDRRYRDPYAPVWYKHLKGHKVALTITITGIYERAWLLEIEAIAAA